MHYDRRRLRLIAKWAKGPDILDVGATQKPNRFLRGQRVVGMDLSPMETAFPYTEFVLCDAMAADTRLSGQTFDSVILGEVIEHVERPYDLLRAMRKLIRPGGRLILSTPNPLGIPVVAAEYAGSRRFFYSGDHTFYFAPRWVWRLLERSGYNVIKTIGCGASVFGFPVPAPRTLSYHVIYVATVQGDLK